MAELDEIYELYADNVMRFLMALSHDRDLSEELTQETFYRAYMNIKNFRGDGKLSVWLCQIAKNLYYAWYNENKRHVPLEEAEELAGAESQEDRVCDSEALRLITKELEALPEPYREVFSFHVLAGIPLKQISIQFGKTESWARVTFHRAKNMIRSRLKGEEE